MNEKITEKITTIDKIEHIEKSESATGSLWGEVCDFFKHLFNNPREPVEFNGVRYMVNDKENCLEVTNLGVCPQTKKFPIDAYKLMVAEISDKIRSTSKAVAFPEYQKMLGEVGFFGVRQIRGMFKGIAQGELGKKPDFLSHNSKNRSEKNPPNIQGKIQTQLNSIF